MKKLGECSNFEIFVCKTAKPINSDSKEILKEDVLQHKEYFERTLKQINEFKNSKNRVHYCMEYQNSGGGLLLIEDAKIAYQWDCDFVNSNLILNYSFKLQDAPKVFQLFEQVKNDNVFLQSFRKHFPTIVEYDKKNKIYTLYYTIDSTKLKPVTAERFMAEKEYNLRYYSENLYKKLKFYEEFQNQKCPLFRKRKFMAGKKIYDAFQEQIPKIVDNRYQNRIKEYTDLLTFCG